MDCFVLFCLLFVVFFLLECLSFKLILCCCGFTRAGIRRGSAGAALMSETAVESGGGVRPGMCVAILQALGARALSPWILLGAALTALALSAVIVYGTDLIENINSVVSRLFPESSKQN